MKKKYIYKPIFTAFLLCYILIGNAQAPDVLYSQFYAAPLQLNPGFTGNTLGPHIALNFRSQWPGFNNGYVTYSAAYSQFWEPLNSGFGLMVQQDNAGNGILKTTNFSGFYSYRVSFRDVFNVKIGVEAGMIQKQLGWDKLVFYDQLDPIKGAVNPTNEPVPGSLTKRFFDVSSGILIYSEKFYGGFSIKHLTTPNESFQNIKPNLNYGLPSRFAIHGGTELTIREGTRKTPTWYLSPNFLFAWQGPFRQVNVGTYFSLGNIFTGAWFRHTVTNGDALIGLLGVQKGSFKFGYSYDYTVSKLANYFTGGSHEVSLIYNFDATRHDETDYRDCFKLFR